MEDKLKYRSNPFIFEIKKNISNINTENFESLFLLEFPTLIDLLNNESFSNIVLNEKEKKIIIIYQYFIQYINYTINHLNKKKNNLNTFLNAQLEIFNKSNIILNDQLNKIKYLKNKIENISKNIFHFEYLHNFLGINEEKNNTKYDDFEDLSDGEIL